MIPAVGDVVHIGAACGAQFRAPVGPFLFEVRGFRRFGHTSDAYGYLSGYRLTADGTRGEQRELYVELAGVRFIGRMPYDDRLAAAPVRRPVNAGPSIPTQRTARTTARSHR